MKKRLIIMACLFPSAPFAEPHTFTWPAMPNPKTVGEFLNIPPEAETYSVMSLSCFNSLNLHLDELGLSDHIPEGEQVTFDTSCNLPDEVPQVTRIENVCPEGYRCMASDTDKPVSNFRRVIERYGGNFEELNSGISLIERDGVWYVPANTNVVVRK